MNQKLSVCITLAYLETYFCFSFFWFNIELQLQKNKQKQKNNGFGTIKWWSNCFNTTVVWMRVRQSRLSVVKLQKEPEGNRFNNADTSCGSVGHLSLRLCPAAAQRPLTATAAIRWEMRAHLAYISEGRARPSTIISADASTAMLSTTLKVKAPKQVTAGHCCERDAEDGVTLLFLHGCNVKQSRQGFYGGGFPPPLPKCVQNFMHLSQTNTISVRL